MDYKFRVAKYVVYRNRYMSGAKSFSKISGRGRPSYFIVYGTLFGTVDYLPMVEVKLMEFMLLSQSVMWSLLLLRRYRRT